MDPRTIEGRLLDWAEAGWLRYRGTGRDMLLTVPDPPPDSQERVAALLADYYAGQEARITEIMTYAKTTGCRHGYISSYFGGRSIERCQSCDNCMQMETTTSRTTRQPRVVTAEADPDAAVTGAILQGVSELPLPLGRRGLARALQGAATSPVDADRFPSFGLLSNRTQKGIAQQVAALEERGLLEPYLKDGYRLLRLTDEGGRYLDRYRQEHPANRRRVPPPPEAPQAKGAVELVSASDQALFERLRAWRSGQASEQKLPPYRILQNAVLKQIAVTCPATAEELLAIRGMGPRKLEQYGAALLELVASHQAESLPITGREFRG
jgi:ATP-dependent DNA helicase RecQ